MISRAITCLLLATYLAVAQQQANPTTATGTDDDAKRHLQLLSKLRTFNSFATSDMRKRASASPGHYAVSYISEPEMVPATRGLTTAAAWLHRITCESDLVVLGNFSKAVSGLSESGALVFSDYHFDVAQTLYEKRPRNLKKIVLVQMGGKVITPDGTFQTVLPWFPGLPVGGPPFHLLFLRHIKQPGTPEDSFLLSDFAGAMYLLPNQPRNFFPQADRALSSLLGGVSRADMVSDIEVSGESCGGRR